MTSKAFLLLVIGQLFCCCCCCNASILLPELNHSFPSMPAQFGRPWPVEIEFSATLQLPNDNWMCKDTMTNSTDEKLPAANPPLALLVERGNCTFYEKAAMAAQIPGVEYVIVYDNEVSEWLVPMSSESPSTMSLLFVSYRSGLELKDLLMQGKGNNHTISIQMDGSMPFLPPPSVDLNLTGFMLAAMAGFLSFLVFFGCALLCAQLGWITARQDDRGRVILMFAASGRRQGANTTVARILSNGKLTSAQVLALPEQEFKPEPSGEDICCAICLDEFQPQEKIRVLPCNHLFHQDCLVPWLTQRHSNCPLCKMDVLDHVLQHSTHKETVRDPTSSSFLRNLVRHWGGWTMVNTTQANTEQDEAGEIEMEVSISTANNAISPTS